MLQLEIKPGYKVYFHECIYSIDFFLNPLRPLLPNRFCLDLGAADGQNGSNTFLLFLEGWNGLAVEKRPDYYMPMHNTYLQLGLDVKPILHEITPENILLLLATYNTPPQFAFLSLDIDSWDYWVLKRLLSAYRPVLICTEINETIPPPLRFTQHDQVSPHAPTHFFGYSLALLTDLARATHYDLVRLDFNNAFLVAREYNAFWPALTAEEAYAPYLRGPRPDYNLAMDACLRLGPAEACAFIQKRFQPFSDQYQLALSALPH